MPYISLDNLSRYDGKIKEFLKAEARKYANWQKTEKSGAVAFKPAPESDLEPVVDFMFTETPPAEGEKGPENPSTIAGVGSVEITLTGKNLVSLPYHSNVGTGNGITWTINPDKSITANGTATVDTNFYFTGVNTTKLRLVENNTYFLSGCPAGGSTSTYYLTAVSGLNDTYVRCYDIGAGATYTPKSSDVCVVHVTIKQGTTVNNITFRPQLESGNSKTSYEVASRERATIQLGDTYYGGSLDVATGVMTVTHAVRQFTGDDGLFWNLYETTSCTEIYNGSSTALYPGRVSGFNIDGVCSHFNKLTSSTGDVVGFGFYGASPGGYFFYPGDITVDGWNAYLAEQYANGTPVTVVYPLAEPFTVQLTPTEIHSLPALDKYEPRINSLYTDQKAVQVGYAKSPICSEYELTQAIIATEGGE